MAVARTLREVRNRTIDLEVEVKRTAQDEQKVLTKTQQERQGALDKMEECEIELTQLEASKKAFRAEMDATEVELKKKLEQKL